MAAVGLLVTALCAPGVGCVGSVGGVDPTDDLAAGLTQVVSGTDFGEQAVGTTSAAFSVTVANDHHQKTVTITSAVIGAPFAVVGPSTPVDVPPMSSVTFYVTFSPTEPGPAEGTLVFSVRRGADVDVSFTGVGVLAGCGNGICDAAEDCASCSSDCGACGATCGDGVCGADETCQLCPGDCGACPATCGDGLCDASTGETCDTCASDCGTCALPGDPTPTRVVDPVAGDDANDGTPLSPWRTLTKAGTAARPGDVVGIRSGRYVEGLDVQVSGETGNRIVFMSHPDNATAPVLEGGCVTIEGRSHVEIRGLRIQLCDGVGDHGSRGIYVVGNETGAAVQDIVLSGNDIYLTRSSAIGVWGVRGGRDPGDFARVRDVVVENNLIERAVEGGYNEQITIANGVSGFTIRFNELRNRSYDGVGGEGIDVKEGCSYGAIHDNTVHDINRRGIYIDGGGYWVDNADPADNLYTIAPTHHIDVYNNVLYNVDSGFAIMSEHGGDVHDIRVFNNLFYSTVDSSDCAFMYDHPYTSDATGNPPGEFWNIDFINNTFWGCTRNGLDLNTQHATGVRVHNNILTTYRDRYDSATEQANLVGGTPGFVDAAAGDYHLTAGSPAVDAGTNDGAPSVDLEGTPRPSGAGVDIGALERTE